MGLGTLKPEKASYRFWEALRVTPELFCFVYMKAIECKKCSGTSLVKAGKIRGRQRYKCKGCKSYFVPKNLRLEKKQLQAVELYLDNMPIRAVSRRFKVSPSTVQRWLEIMSEKLMPLIPLKSKSIEMDELYLYIKKKKSKRWLWLALCRDTKRIVGFHVGGRGQKALKTLYNSISVIECSNYYTDGHAPYKNVLPKKKHSTATGQTNTIEGINSAIRHYLARFRRRSKCYSKSMRMVEVTIQLMMYKYDSTYQKQLTSQAA
ncbi:MAG: IS1 family transposase [Bacteroidota bacterium]